MLYCRFNVTCLKQFYRHELYDFYITSLASLKAVSGCNDLRFSHWQTRHRIPVSDTCRIFPID
jgi:hypothetical protein